MNLSSNPYIQRIAGIPKQIKTAALWHVLTGVMTLYFMLRVITPPLVSQIGKVAPQDKVFAVELARDLIAFANSISAIAAASILLGLVLATGSRWAWILALASNLAGMSVVVRRPFILIVNGSPSYLHAALLPVVFLLPALTLYSKPSRVFCRIDGSRFREIMIALAGIVLLFHFGIISLFEWYEELLARINDLPPNV